MALKFIGAADVAALLSMASCIDAMSAAMSAASSGASHAPPRVFMPLRDPGEALLLMPGRSSRPNVYGAKVISLHPGNRDRGLPAIQGFVALFDGETGTPLAIVDGSSLTSIRTAAASALATRHLARPDARSHGVFGTGALAGPHVEAVHLVRPCSRVLVWGRNLAKARALAASLARRTGLDVRPAGDPREAAACDVVTTVTGAAEPILLGRWIRPGTHVNLVGAHSATTREGDSDLAASARIFTDSLESLWREGGDVLIPLAEGRIDRSQVAGEIGRVIEGELPGRTADADVTLYKSHGITAQDLFAAYAVWSRALEERRGIDLPA